MIEIGPFRYSDAQWCAISDVVQRSLGRDADSIPYQRRLVVADIAFGRTRTLRHRIEDVAAVYLARSEVARETPGRKARIKQLTALCDRATALRDDILAAFDTALVVVNGGLSTTNNPALSVFLDLTLYPNVDHDLIDITKLKATIAREIAALEQAPRTINSGEVLGARWDEIDLKAGVWVVPPERMKAGKEHRVPLSDRAVAVLEELRQARISDFVFPGFKRGRPLSNMAMDAVLRRAGIDATTHGFRSSFRDWAGDHTSFPRDVVEAALAHSIENKTEAAYRRSDPLEERPKLMAAWDKYCNAPAKNNVTPLRSMS